MKIKIEFCLGSSCFARGNRIALNEMEKYIKDNNLSDQISITGRLCMKNCSEGPVVKISDRFYFGKNSSDLIKIIESEIK